MGCSSAPSVKVDSSCVQSISPDSADVIGKSRFANERRASRDSAVSYFVSSEFELPVLASSLFVGC